MTTAPTPSLLPCPFCGGSASAHEVNPKEAPGWVHLTVEHAPDCFYRVPKETLLLSAFDLERWNRRAELEARKPLPLSDEQIDAAADRVDNEPGFMCGFRMGARFAERASGVFGLVDKSPNLQEPLVDKTANLQDRPAPLSDDDLLRLRSDVARAIWDVMREHEDRCDHALEDVEPKHQVWDCADAAIKAVHGITGGSS